mmetsp:Transcript_11948/g.16226  ORF Transcript_11948/g.16226 Transcript_11948/m.16226 type:complete len:126 (+) Transcript_11948:254-631(+)
MFGLACWNDEQILISAGFKSIIFDRGGHLKSVLAYDIKRDKWTSKGDLNKRRAQHASCILKDKAYVFGGAKSASAARGCIEVLDLLSERKGWELLHVSLPNSRYLLGACPLNNREIVFFGGKKRG